MGLATRRDQGSWWFILLSAAVWSLWIPGVGVAVGEAATLVFPNVITNGGFEDDQDGDGKPDGWQVEGTAVRKQPGALGLFSLELSGTASTPNAKATQRVSIVQPVPSTVTLACLVKGVDIRSTGGGEGLAELSLSFFAKDGSRIGWPLRLKTWRGTFEWKPWVDLVRVPANATELELGLVLSGATGQILFDEAEVLWQFPDDYDRENLVVDGGFEYYSLLSSWNLGGGQQVLYPGFDRHAALSISLSQAGRSEASQQLVFVDPSAIQSATLAFALKRTNVVAAQIGGGAKAQLRFWDSQGDPIEPAVVLGPWKGTTTWTELSFAVTVPVAAREATLSLLLDQASGTVSFDAVRLTATSSQGPVLRPVESRNDTLHWHSFVPVQGPLVAPVDASALLDAPAGSHGFLTVQNGHFAFQDGTPVRFFGLNMQGSRALPSHADAEVLAERLAQLGCNLVRLHHLDAPWSSPNLFDPSFNDTQHLSADSLDRLDYFIAQLKARGIYVYLDLLVSRQFKEGDGVAAASQLSRGAKIVAEYNPRIIELQQQYASALLTHVNPYTNTRLVDEPAIALVEIINESSLFDLPREASSIPQVYLDELKQRWVDWLTAQGVANPDQEADRFLDLNDPQVQQCYAELQVGYFQQMHSFLRGLGLRIPIGGSNRALEGWDLWTNAALDFIDRHGYWDSPKGGFGDLVKVHNDLIIEVAQRHNPVVKLSHHRVLGKPLIISEWNIAWPNEYRAAGPMLMAAYGSFHDWDGLVQFRYDGELLPARIHDNFDVSTKPELFLQLPVAARVFHRRDVRPALARSAYLVLTNPSIPVALTFQHGIDRILTGLETLLPVDTVKPWVSDTTQLSWDDTQGLVLIETPRTQAVIGNVAGSPRLFRDVTFSSTTPFACLILTSLDDQPLDRSAHLWLTAVGRTENTGTIYNATRTLLRTSGETPILLEPVEGTAQLPLGTRPVPAVYALDSAGHRAFVVPITAPAQTAEIPLGQSPYYEIVFESAQGNAPPVLDPIGDRTVNAGALLTVTLTAADPDGDPLTSSASNLPVGAAFDPITRTFSWIPTAEQAGVYSVTFSVSDGVLSDSETILITVTSVNLPPVLTPIGNKTVTAGKLLQFSVSATDPENDPLTYSAAPLPAGATFTGQTFSWTPTSSQAGTTSVTFTVDDGRGGTDSETITITVRRSRTRR